MRLWTKISSWWKTRRDGLERNDEGLIVLRLEEDSKPFGPTHESAGDESAQEKADDIREWLEDVTGDTSVTRPLVGGYFPKATKTERQKDLE